MVLTARQPLTDERLLEAERRFEVLAEVRDRGDKEYAAMESPDQLLVVAAGGPAGGFGAIIPPWLGNKSYAVTLPIGVCVDCEPPK